MNRVAFAACVVQQHVCDAPAEMLRVSGPAADHGRKGRALGDTFSHHRKLQTPDERGNHE
jgi:hypothetical protein